MAAWGLVLFVGLALEAGACSGTGTSGSAGKTDAGLAEGTFDSGVPSDAAGDLNTATPDTSLGNSDGDAGWCGLPRTTLGQACDLCVQTNCEPAWCACADQPATLTDAASAAADGGSDDSDASIPDAEAANAETGADDARGPDAGRTDAGSADADADARSDRGADADADEAASPGADGAVAQGENPNGEASGPGCLGYATCVEGCVADDAGSPTDCFQTVCALPDYTATEQQAGHAFLDCLVQYCAHDCGE